MTLYQYNALSENEQVEVLWNRGTMVTDRINEDCRYIVYQIDSFYVEVEYNGKQNVIQRIKSFLSTGEPPQPYLESIILPTFV